MQLDLQSWASASRCCRRDLNEAQNHLHEVELKRTEHRLQADNIRVQAGEKFGITIEE